MNNEQEEQYQKALKLLTEEKWLKAASLLEDLLNQVPSDDVTKSLVLALYRGKQYARAFVYLVEQPAVFAADQSNARLAVHLLLHNQSYISVRLFIAGLPADWQRELIQLVEEGERDARQKFRTTIQTELRSFYHLGDCSLNEQQERLSEAQQLPLDEYLTGAQFLLRDPFTHQLIKASIVDTLRQIGIEKEMVIRWIDGEEYSFVPGDLLSIDDLELVQALRNELTNELGNHNPSELQLANQELQMQLMLLYPLINDQINDVKEWVRCLIMRIRGEKGKVNPKIMATQEQLTKIIDDLSEKH